jgi:hypothetical protein
MFCLCDNGLSINKREGKEMKYSKRTGMNYRGWHIQFNDDSFTAYDPADHTAGYYVRETIKECKEMIDQYLNQ